MQNHNKEKRKFYINNIITESPQRSRKYHINKSKVNRTLITRFGELKVEGVIISNRLSSRSMRWGVIATDGLKTCSEAHVLKFYVI